ncbi:PQQ-binding-like beta-propeller repeat protein [Bowmanella denitrificans]|uniref:PQQ-binding-like beta-propeller repeat protein n=1 Tax=Bowmanella denitrificans TaxID=366582 RepID=UPI000C9CF313|nr:PQQ-binding-like beta-propeller repeat protein [Bowmanella denitrificans]
MEISAQPQWTAEPQSGYQINSTAISANGKVCVLGTSQEYGNGDFSVFCYNGKGALLWQDKIGEDIYQGVYWVAVSGNGNYAAAGGTLSHEGTDTGFLYAYDSVTGKRLLELQTQSRVNQVALSDSGETLVAVAGNQLLLCVLQNGQYQMVDQYSYADQYCQSCQLSADGSVAVVATTRNYDVTQGPAGTVAQFSIIGSKLQTPVLYQAQTSLQRVAISYDGTWWAAASHNGQALAFSIEQPDTPVWQYQPDGLDLSVAYAIAIQKGVDGQVYLVCGANLHEQSHGCLYAVTSSATLPATPTPMWQKNTQYDPNPGVNMDRQAIYVTATDGQPEQSGQETPGNFYLIDVQSGSTCWQVPTSLMNWPMAINTDASAIFGASDNGLAYYWSAS